jgi:hypothetical protein
MQLAKGSPFKPTLCMHPFVSDKSAAAESVRRQTWPDFVRPAAYAQSRDMRGYLFKHGGIASSK